MREIIFRGKRVDNGEWVEGGSLLQFLMIGGCKKMSIAPRGKKPHIKKDGQVIQAEEIFPETVGQYTGLKDKNGKRIFEGDIVKQEFSKLRQSTNGICEFHNGSFGLKIKVLGIERFFPFACICNSTYEVIGNIHDNPELLKGE